MKKGGIEGANIRTGLIYEGKVDIVDFITSYPGYRVDGTEIFYQDKLVAHAYKKHGFYAFLKSKGVDWRKYISKQLLPDNCVYVIVNNTVFIIEVKTQHVAGSVDEKLQTCDFKKKQYQKLLAQVNIDVEYVYILDKWFRDSKYKDTLDYIHSVRCQYYFEYIPLYKLGLPVP